MHLFTRPERLKSIFALEWTTLSQPQGTPIDWSLILIVSWSRVLGYPV